ncbi:hypothetical protein LY78DRAFT_226587 [Colletotrichum sublineola]|nr:hypothetical protein LY78DRAFT_226587 [Colletotrichum sublineola]
MEPRPMKGFPCRVPNCTSKPFPTKANLNRHTKSKHGPPVRMPCGKLLTYHPCNTQRHQKSCPACCRKLKAEGAHQEPKHISPSRHGSTEPSGAHSTPAPHDDSVYISLDVLNYEPLRDTAALEEQPQIPSVSDKQLLDALFVWQDQTCSMDGPAFGSSTCIQWPGCGVPQTYPNDY